MNDDDVKRWDSPPPTLIESGQGLPREERKCWECQSGKIEDVPHWLLECDVWCTE